MGTAKYLKEAGILSDELKARGVRLFLRIVASGIEIIFEKIDPVTNKPLRETTIVDWSTLTYSKINPVTYQIRKLTRNEEEAI